MRFLAVIDFAIISSTLTRLDTEYTGATDANMQLLYSKLAVLEFCGWIEVSFDTLWHDYVANKLAFQDNINRIKKIIKKNYGFDYDKNIYPIMCSVLGVNNWENILDAFPVADFSNMSSILSSYTNVRNTAAHTNTQSGVTPTYTAPSTVKADYIKLKPAFQYLETSISAL